MVIFSEEITILLLDGISCALLAAAATCRARNLGAHITGALVLGCLCGLIGPLLREAFLHGQIGTRIVAREMPAEALVGSLGALAAAFCVRNWPIRLFFWLDSASIGLAGSLGTVMTLSELGIVGALCIGLINGLAPGLVRDMALGDTALLVDQDWYATAAALGCVAAIAVFIWLSVGWITEWTAAHAEETAVLSGCLLVIALRAWRDRRGSEA